MTLDPIQYHLLLFSAFFGLAGGLMGMAAWWHGMDIVTIKRDVESLYSKSKDGETLTKYLFSKVNKVEDDLMEVQEFLLDSVGEPPPVELGGNVVPLRPREE